MTAMTHLFDTPTDWIELGDCTLPYYRIGAGPDLVLVHGWPLDSRTWRNLLPRLSAQYTCHMFDMPGTGRSRWSAKTRVGLAENAAAVRKCIDAIGLTSYALIGHDSGACFARLVAAGDPDRVRALVVGNTEIPGYEPWQLKVMGVAMNLPGGIKGLTTLMRFKLGRRSQFMFGGCFADTEVAEGEFFDLFLRPLIDDPRALAGQLLLGKNLDFSVVHSLREAHGKITAPTRFIWGVDDPWFPLDKARAMPAQMGGEADLVTLAPGKLFAHEEFPDLFLDAAEPVLAKGFATTLAAAA
jgi:haloalkane dehalogenase